MKQIIQQLKKSKNVFIASHKNPDGDAIGALIAMGLALEAIQKNVTCYNEGPVPAAYRFLPAVNRIVSYSNFKRDYDTAIILDCGNIKRIGKATSLVKTLSVIINIDHHTTNTNFGHFNFIDVDACASVEIVYKIIKRLNIPISCAMAKAIYTGIFTDTGSFRFSNTNLDAFKICEEMIGLGVDPYTISKNVYENYSVKRVKLLNLALDTFELFYDGMLSMMILTKEMITQTNTKPEDMEGFINYIKGIKDVRVAILIQEKQNGRGKLKDKSLYHVSLRSDDTVDVAAIAKVFGGGGHSRAAGFSAETKLKDLKASIFNLSEKVFMKL